MCNSEEGDGACCIANISQRVNYAVEGTLFGSEEARERHRLRNKGSFNGKIVSNQYVQEICEALRV